MQKKQRISIIGSGYFATALAQALAIQGQNITIWTRHQEVYDSIGSSRRNAECFQDIPLDPKITCRMIQNQSDAEHLQHEDMILVCIPVQVLEAALLPFQPWLQDAKIIISCSKGIEIKSLRFPVEIIKKMIPKTTVVGVLSGPSFATEIMGLQPTGLVIATENKEVSLFLKQVMSGQILHVDQGDDYLSLEIAGAVKNVIAIAVGAADGLEFQQNTRACLITKGLQEMVTIGQALKAKTEGFYGLGGVGDLFLTASSSSSRNYQVGLEIGRGAKVENVLSQERTAEGVWTAKALYNLQGQLNLSLPILTAVYHVLHEGLSLEDAKKRLMS